MEVNSKEGTELSDTSDRRSSGTLYKTMAWGSADMATRRHCYNFNNGLIYRLREQRPKSKGMHLMSTISVYVRAIMRGNQQCHDPFSMAMPLILSQDTLCSPRVAFVDALSKHPNSFISVNHSVATYHLTGDSGICRQISDG